MSAAPEAPVRRRGAAGRLLHRAPALVGVALMAAAIVVVTHEFRHLRPADILVAIRRIPLRAEAFAAAWTVAAYLVLTFYDRLGTRYAGVRLPWTRTAFASFTAYVLSHNLGFSALSGGAVRFRLYTAWGLTPAQIARVVGFCSLTFLLGAVSIGGAVAIAAPAAVPLAGTGVPRFAIRAAGVLMWLAVLGYVGLSHRHERIRIRGHAIELPGLGLAIRQVALAMTDVGTTATIAYTLLPAAPHLTYPRFLTVYLVAYTAGLAASVPGGLGVFETAMLLGLHPWLPASSVLGAVLVFRLYYYVVPLFLAGGMFAGHELWLRGAAARRLAARPDAAITAAAAARRGRGSAPALRATEADFSVVVATALTALSGAALLLVGGLDLPRAAGLGGPARAMLSSHAGSYALSLIGTALTVLAVGLSMRVTLAWAASIVLLVFASVVCLVEQLGVWVAGPTLLVALLMLPFRASYHRRARLFASPLEPRTVLAAVGFAASVVALAALEPQFRYLDHDTWWQLVLSRALPDRLRASMALLVAVLLLATWRLVRPGPVAWRVWDEACRRRFERLGAEPPGGADGVVFGENGRSCLAFRRVGDLLVGLGDPAGHAGDRVSAIRRLRDLAREEGRAAAAWGAGSELIGAWASVGLRAWPASRGGYVCCGDEADRQAVVDGVEPRSEPRRAGRTPP